MKLLLLILPAALPACATPAPRSGLMSNHDGLAARAGAVRASVAERRTKKVLRADSVVDD